MRVIQPKTLTIEDSNVNASALSAWDSGTTYAKDDEVVYTVNGIPREYRSLLASNLNFIPSARPDYWLDLGAENRHKLLDEASSSQTVGASPLTTTLSVDGRCDTLALLNLEAQSVQVVVRDGLTVVSDETINLTSTLISDWYSYFFDEFEYIPQYIYVVPGLYASMEVDLTFTNSGTDVKVGHVVMGKGKDIGMSMYGLSRGILDFSSVETNDFGETYFQQREYARTFEVDIELPRADYPIVASRVEAVRSTPCLWDLNNTQVSADSDQSLFIYGFFVDWELEMKYATWVTGTIEIQGLT